MSVRTVKSMSLSLAVAIAITAALPLASSETTSGQKPPATTTNASPTEDLVAAAKASKAKRTSSSGKKKVITNADVKKSKGRLILISSSDSKGDGKAKEPEDPRSLAEQNAERIKTRQEAETRLAAAEKAVDDLKIELVRAEQRYYEANDPSFRERVLRERFDTIRKQLDDAMLALDDAKAAMAAADPPR